MRKLPLLILALVLLPAALSAQEKEPKKLMIFPFRIEAQDGKVSYGNEPAAVFGAELMQEGDVTVVSGGPFDSAIKGKKVDSQRIARIVRRIGATAGLWGKIAKFDEGYAMDVWVTGSDPDKKAKLYSASAKDMEGLVEEMRKLAGQLGRDMLGRPVIGNIRVEGNKRVPKDTILKRLELKPGDPFRKSELGSDIRGIYSLGHFDDVQIKAEDESEGKVDLRIVLKERPFTKEVEVEGNTVYSKAEILDKLTTKSVDVASQEKISDDIAAIKKMYEQKGYFEPKIEYEIVELSGNEAKLIFKINEGRKSYLTRLVLDGAHKVTEKELKKILPVKEKGLLWFLDDSGSFTREKLEEARRMLLAYYMTKGFVDVQVGAPEVQFEDGSATVTYAVREGDRYQVRKVDVQGDLIMPKEKLLEKLKTKPRNWYNQRHTLEDIQTLVRTYNNAGYAYADVQPAPHQNAEHDFVDIVYKISRGPRVTIERVDIRGNNATRGKVIRRNLSVSEGDLYSGDSLEASKKALERMDYFEAVTIKSLPGSRPDLMNLDIEVVEKRTGSLAAGLGFSSQEGAMGNINLRERNLAGLGIVANMKADISARRSSYEGSITYPWLFDWPLSATVSGYKSHSKESKYFRESDGFNFSVQYPFYGRWSISAGIGRDSSKLMGFDRGFARSLVHYYGRYGARPEKFLNMSENSVSLSLSRSTSIGSPIPFAGTQVTVGSRFSGFGADVEFSRHFTETVYYQRLFWQAIVKVRGYGSFLVESGGSPIPFDRRTMLGGINSVRGYQYGEIGPRDKFGNIMGGDRALFANLECLFPLIESLKMNGIVFCDVGNAWNVNQLAFPKDAKAGAGIGIRWVSPMGPLRIEYGWKLRPERGEAAGALHFAMGQLF